MSPAQTKIMLLVVQGTFISYLTLNGREMSRQTSAKQTNAETQASRNQTNIWSKVQEDARSRSSKSSFYHIPSGGVSRPSNAARPI